MKRTVWTIAFLCIGAVLNIAVAWGCALFVHAGLEGERAWYPTDPPMTSQGRGLDYFVVRRDAFGTTNFDVHVGWSDRSGAKGPELSAIDLYWSGIPGSLRDPQVLSNVTAHGWPYRSLLYRWGRIQTIEFVGGIELPDFDHPPQRDRGQYLRALPYDPIWPGFIANTLIYASASWLLLGLPFTICRMRRRKRNLCPACAYPIGTNPRCTECGTQLDKSIPHPPQ